MYDLDRPSMLARIPPIQCLLTFEAVARLRSVTLAAEELCVTPSAASHRIRQLEQNIGAKLFSRSNFSLTAAGSEYLAHVREGLLRLQKFPISTAGSGKCKLRLAAPPTFLRTVLIPRLHQFTEAYPEIDFILHLANPMQDALPKDADVMIRYGTGAYSDVEHVCLMTDDITPMASPAYVREHGPFDTAQDLQGLSLLRSPLEPWVNWFSGNDLDWPEPPEGSQFNDLGLMCDAAAAGLGIALGRLKLAAPWLSNGTLMRLYSHDIESPNAYYLCWRKDVMQRWECVAFSNWLRKSIT
ncbi:MAG: LysR family glycine cleavage system transcriptional activator [Janthinobacterium sp.]|jgi:LysR family glycine cleavage system transcriptional activator